MDPKALNAAVKAPVIRRDGLTDAGGAADHDAAAIMMARNLPPNASGRSHQFGRALDPRGATRRR